MRISESKRFLWHGLCLLPQGTMRSLGKRDCCCCHGRDMRRVELLHTTAAVGQGKPASSTSTNWHNSGVARAAPPGTRAARSSPPHLQRHSDSFRLGIREEFPPSRASRTWNHLLARVGWGGRKNAFEIEFSYTSSLLERAQLEGQADVFRPAFLQNWPLITAAAMQTGCCYGCICLLHSYVPALNPAFAFRSAVTAQRWQ